MEKRALLYCNPLPLPDYQRGRLSQDKTGQFWVLDSKRDYREMADPTVIRFAGRWYLFPSCGMLWHSDDMVNWTYHRIEPWDAGYAPTVVQKGEWLYLTACGKRMYRAREPLGKWEDLGELRDHEGKPVEWNDPMLFVDDDGTMYCYHGLGKDGIYVVRLDADDPTRWAEPPRHCFAFNPEHIWERRGEHNIDPEMSYIEGAWMTRHAGKYYLQYSANGTEWKSYALGCYIGDSPVGPWRPQKRNPILVHRGGLVNGAGHHSMVEGPDGELWCFYTTLVKIEHWFERRIGMDPVAFDGNGEMMVAGPTERPQYAPGTVERRWRGDDAGLLPVTVNQPVTASSYLYGHEPPYAVDDNIRTWWEAAAGGPQWLQVDLHRPYRISAARTMFADRGLDYARGVVPAPYRYRIEGSADGKTFATLFDASANARERHIAFDVFPEQVARYVRLTVLETPAGMAIGVWEFTAFGRA